MSRPPRRLVVRRGRLAKDRSGSEAAASAGPAVPNAIGPAIGRPASGLGRGRLSQTTSRGRSGPRTTRRLRHPRTFRTTALVCAFLLAAALLPLTLPLPAFLAFLPLELLGWGGRGGRVGDRRVKLPESRRLRLRLALWLRPGRRGGHGLEEGGDVRHDVGGDLLEGPTLTHFHGECGGGRRPIVAQGLYVHRPGAGLLVPPGDVGVDVQDPRQANRLEPVEEGHHTPAFPKAWRAPPDGSLPPAASLLSSSADVQVRAAKISPSRSGV